MNCNLIKQKIDHLVFEKDSLLVAEVGNHIESCDSCKSYFNESISTNKMLELLKSEPKLHNPIELTNSILSVIEHEDQIPNATNKIGHHKILQIVRRSLAAASVSLMIIFGTEQYIVFDKILKLENVTSKISNEHENISFQKILQYNTGRHIDFYKELIMTGFDNPNHRKIKTRLLLARLSSISMNEIDEQKTRQLHRAISTMNSN